MSKKILQFFAIAFILSSCNFYKPTLIHAPVLEKKGDLNVCFGVGSSFDANMSYTITDNVAIMASVGNTINFTVNNNDGTSTEEYEFSNNKYEGALGYYNRLGDNYYYNAFAGYAFGNSGALLDRPLLVDFFKLDLGAYGSKFQGPFIQGNIHKKLDEKTSLGFVYRINHFKFDDFVYSFDTDIIQDYMVSDDISLINQIGIDLNIKGHKMGGLGQLQYVFHDNKDNYFTTRKLSLHLGIFFFID